MAPLLAKAIAAKPHTPLRIVTSDGRIVICFNFGLRTRRKSFFLAVLVFDLGIFRIEYLMFYYSYFTKGVRPAFTLSPVLAKHFAFSRSGTNNSVLEPNFNIPNF